MKGMKLLPAETNINFIGARWAALVLSAALLIGAVVLTAKDGLNFGIDFAGGTMIEVRVSPVPELETVRRDLNALGLGSISIQEFGQPDDLLIRLPQQDPPSPGGFGRTSAGPDAQKAAIGAVRDMLDNGFESVDYRRVEFVGPQVGEELKQQGLYAVLFSLIGILAYIWFRFEWQFGVAAIIALAHDSILTIGLFALTQLEFNLSTVAAILMIAGYSINDTVVVFDRIREKLRKYKKMPLPELFNLAVNKTLGRTLMTSVTTLLALIALYSFGGEVIRDFVIALIFGIVIGTYSSVFIAAPVLLFMNVRKAPAAQE